MGSVRSQIISHPLTTFFVATVGLGWILTIGVAQLSSNPAVLPLIAIPVSFVPALVAGLVLRVAGTTEERVAWRHRLTRVRVGWRWYVVALLALPLAYLVGIGLAAAGGATFPFHLQTVALLPILLVTNFGEEIGWRGYALPTLQDRSSPLVAGLVVGAAWGAFHWVALAANADAPLGYIAVSTIQLTAISVIMTFVFNGSRESVPLVALMHADVRHGRDRRGAPGRNGHAADGLLAHRDRCLGRGPRAGHRHGRQPGEVRDQARQSGLERIACRAVTLGEPTLCRMVLASWENVVTFGLPDPDEALREAEQRDVEAERKAELAESEAPADEKPEPDPNDEAEDEKT